jgi:hypothetical protein
MMKIKPTKTGIIMAGPWKIPNVSNPFSYLRIKVGTRINTTKGKMSIANK